MTYLQFLGLWLNRDRIIHRKARAVQIGVKLGSGKVVAGLDYYLANFDSEAEAKYQMALDRAGADNGT